MVTHDLAKVELRVRSSLPAPMKEIMDKHKVLFGIPMYHTKIDPISFKKDKIIKDITKNYKKDPTRNNWDSLYGDSHHGYQDWNNKNFIKPDFTDLIPIYTNIITKFLNSLGNNQLDYTFKFFITNYTCMSERQWMGRHNHIECDFVGTHYIKFPTKARSTFYYNQMTFADYLGKGATEKDVLRNLYSPEDIRSSWLYPTWCENIEEDDLVIIPGLLAHGVPKNESKELRMTIVMNIHLTFNNQKECSGD